MIHIFSKNTSNVSLHFSELEIKNNILALKKKIENFYNAEFNFDDKFIYYPLYKVSGKYTDFSFN